MSRADNSSLEFERAAREKLISALYCHGDGWLSLYFGLLAQPTRYKYIWLPKVFSTFFMCSIINKASRISRNISSDLTLYSLWYSKALRHCFFYIILLMKLRLLQAKKFSTLLLEFLVIITKKNLVWVYDLPRETRFHLKPICLVFWWRISSSRGGAKSTVSIHGKNEFC